MSSVQPLLWRSSPNTSIPSVNHLFSFRCNFAAQAAGATVTVPLPVNQYSTAYQYTQAQNASNFAVTASPSMAQNEPQQGLLTYITHLVVRNVSNNSPITPSGGTPASIAIALINQSQGNAAILSIAGPSANTVVPYIVAFVGNSLNPYGNNVVNPYDQLAVTFTSSASVASAVTGFILDAFGFFNQAV